MGLVYPAERIMEGRIPVAGAHEAAANFIVDQLFYKQLAFEAEDTWVECGIDSGMIYGSSTHGTAGIRSDLDELIIYRDFSSAPGARTLDIIRRVNARARDEFNVDIEANTLTFENVAGRNHRIDPIFLGYLLAAQENGQFSWHFPASEIAQYFRPEEFEHLSLVRDLQRYTGDKSAKFDRALAVTEYFDLHCYQRALELPKNIGRKILSVFQNGFDAGHASGAEIMSGMEAFFALEDEHILGKTFKKGALAMDALTKLLAVDAEYDELLDDAISGRRSIIDYEGWLNDNGKRALSLASEACAEIQATLSAYRFFTEDREAEPPIQAERLFDFRNVETFYVGEEEPEDWIY